MIVKFQEQPGNIDERMTHSHLKNQKGETCGYFICDETHCRFLSRKEIELL